MKTIETVRTIESIDDFLHDATRLSERFYTWSAEKDDDFINDPDRAARCHDAAQDGADGATHAEHIDDFREFGHELLAESEREIDEYLFGKEMSDEDFIRRTLAADEQLCACRIAFDADCDKLEQWHIENGSYAEQVG